MSPPIIETARLILRLHCMDDAEALFALRSDAEMMRYMSRPDPPETGRETIERYLRHHADHGYGQWAVVLRETGEFIGNAGPSLQTLDDVPYTQIGWFIDKRHWGRGLATEAARASLDWSFANLDVDRLVAFIIPENLASVRVAQRLGMTWWKSGVFKGDEVSAYSIARRDWNGPRARPV